VKALIAERHDARLEELSRGYTRAKATALKGENIDVASIAKVGLGYERLDQLMVEHMLGVH
jgi:hypothetical protein